MQGKIYKGIGSFYTVHSECGVFVCKARGRFRKDDICPSVGDNVEFVQENTGHSFITEILPRKNVLIRPAAANIDKLIIVMSASVPYPDFYLTDKLMLSCEMLKIVPVIVINKCDTDTGGADEISKQYAHTGYKIYRVSAQTGEGIDSLKTELCGCTSCFAGQSAVGKSSILNCILPELNLETGDLSRKTERGRHTTRHCELWELPESGAVLDTPGFSLLYNVDIEPSSLQKLYPEMRKCSDKCRFTGCLHIKEPDCAVKELVKSGGMSQQRYERYLSIYSETAEHYKHRYD